MYVNIADIQYMQLGILRVSPFVISFWAKVSCHQRKKNEEKPEKEKKV